MRFFKYLQEEDAHTGFKGWPDGWSKESLEKWAESFAENHDGLMPDDENWWDTCVDAMQDEDNFDEENAKKFCSALKDEYLGTEDWRGE